MDILKMNESKYGKKEIDRIAKAYDVHPICGISFCMKNALKYIDRFLSDDVEKSKLESDITKISVYLLRTREKYYLSETTLKNALLLLENRQMELLRDLLEEETVKMIQTEILKIEQNVEKRGEEKQNWNRR